MFKRTQMSGPQVDELMELWAASQVLDDCSPPYFNNRGVNNHIDQISVGEVPWTSLCVKHTGTLPICEPPSWMMKNYEVWYRDPREVVHKILLNPEFNGEFDYTPYREFRDEKQEWSHFMSGN